MLRLVGLIGFVALLLAPSGTTLAQAPKADASVQKTLETLMNAIINKDRDAFVADATDAVKKETTKEVIEAFEKHVGTRLKNGYEATYLCQLKQAGHQIHLWKVAFKDGSDEVVVRLALKDGKVASLHLQ
jgi:hypothetical protein